MSVKFWHEVQYSQKVQFSIEYLKFIFNYDNLNQHSLSSHSANQAASCHPCWAGTTAGESERELERRGLSSQVTTQSSSRVALCWLPGQSREQFQYKKNHFVKTNFTYFFPTKREMIYMRNKIDNLSETLGDLLVLSWIFSYPVTFEMFSTNLGRGKHIMIFVQLPLENLISIFSI